MDTKNNKFKLPPIFKYAIAFAVGVLVFFPVLFKFPYLYGFDGYYHSKLGQLILERGFLKEFPWMYFTSQHEHFVNPFYIFHLYLGIFQKLFDWGPFFAVRAATLVLMGLISVWYIRILECFSKKWHFLFLLLLFAVLSASGYTRFSLVRPHILSLLMLLMGTEAALKKKWWLLGILSFLYTYSYVACYLIPLLAIIAGIIFSVKEKKLIYKAPLISLSAMAAGLFLNPSFPNNITYIYEGTFKMAMAPLPFAGREWLSPVGWTLFSENWPIFTMMFVVIIIALNLPRKFSMKTVFLFTISSVFFVLLLRSARFIEYWTFMAALFISGFLLEFFETKVIPEKILKKYIIPISAVLLFSLGAFNLSTTYKKAAISIPIEQLNTAMNVLNNEAQPGDIVFSEDWEMFSPMFYMCDKVYYLQGLDPGMMRLAHPGLFDVWFNITAGKVNNNVLPFIIAVEKHTNDPEIRNLRIDIESGKVPNNLAGLIKHAFNASWIFLTHGHVGERYDLRKILDQYPNDFIKIYKSQFFSIYKIKD